LQGANTANLLQRNQIFHQLEETLEQKKPGLAPAWLEAVEERIGKLRAELKERFRRYPGFQEADGTAFDQAVDQELDALRRKIQQAGEDNDLAEGLRALAGGG
jgi:HPt (histidine-containing phosphotransfer) domain-containing protein